MVEIAPFNVADLDTLDVPTATLDQFATAGWRAMIAGAAAAGPSWTGRLDGRVIGCAGVALLWPGRAAGWCLLGQGIPKRAWVGIHRAVVARLAQTPELGVRRIEAEAVFGFLPATRWLEMLGFEREGVARGYGPDGSDFIRFARIT